MLTHDAGLAQTGDGLSVGSSGLGRGGARAGEDFWFWDKAGVLRQVQTSGSDLVVKTRACGVVPARHVTWTFGHWRRQLNINAWCKLSSTWLTSRSEQEKCCCNASGWVAPVCMPIIDTNAWLSKSICCFWVLHRLVAYHRVCGVEQVEEAFTDRCGEDVILHGVVSRPDPAKCQKNSQRRAHAEEVFHLTHKRRFKSPWVC